MKDAEPTLDPVTFTLNVELASHRPRQTRQVLPEIWIQGHALMGMSAMRSRQPKRRDCMLLPEVSPRISMGSCGNTAGSRLLSSPAGPATSPHIAASRPPYTRAAARLRTTPGSAAAPWPGRSGTEDEAMRSRVQPNLLWVRLSIAEARSGPHRHPSPGSSRPESSFRSRTPRWCPRNPITWS